MVLSLEMTHEAPKSGTVSAFVNSCISPAVIRLFAFTANHPVKCLTHTSMNRFPFLVIRISPAKPIEYTSKSYSAGKTKKFEKLSVSSIAVTRH